MNQLNQALNVMIFRVESVELMTRVVLLSRPTALVYFVSQRDPRSQSELLELTEQVDIPVGERGNS